MQKMKRSRFLEDVKNWKKRCRKCEWRWKNEEMQKMKRCRTCEDVEYEKMKEDEKMQNTWRWKEWKRCSICEDEKIKEGWNIEKYIEYVKM